MIGTQATTSDNGSGRTKLAEAIESGEKEDRRPCRQESCHGTLSVTDDDTVLCQTCRCRPDGVFVPPTSDSGGNDTDDNPVFCNQTLIFTTPSIDPSWKGEKHPWARPRNKDRERYRHSGTVRLLGGFTESYPSEMTTRDDSLI